MNTEHELLEAVGSFLPEIEAVAEEIEKTQRVPDSIIARFDELGLFSMAVPKEFGGSEMDPLVVFEIIEMIAAVDASTAWVLLIIYANPFIFGNCLHRSAWESMYGDDISTRTAGALAPTGKAVKTDGGYRVSGRFRWGSGSEHCQYLLSGCMVFDGDSMCRKESGEPEMRVVIHKTSDATIHFDSWDSTGLRGSSSHDYSLDDVFIADEWTFVLGETVYAHENPIYSFPGIAFCQLGAIGLGMARASLDMLKEMSLTKRRGPLLMADDPSVQLGIAEAEAKVSGSRAWLRQCMQAILDSFRAGAEPSRDDRARYRLACTHAMDNAVEVVNMVYKNAGGNGVYKPSKLDRFLRDIHTASTHLRVSDNTYIKSGRMLLGMDPEDPLF